MALTSRTVPYIGGIVTRLAKRMRLRDSKGDYRLCRSDAADGGRCTGGLGTSRLSGLRHVLTQCGLQGLDPFPQRMMDSCHKEEAHR